MAGQNPLGVVYAKGPAGNFVPLQADANGYLLTLPSSGEKSALNQTAAAVIKVGAGRVGTVIIVAPGTTSGAFTLNDCATTGAAAAANEIWTMAYNATANVAGAIIPIDFPVTTGLVLSAVPGAGSPIISISYT